MSVFLKIYQRLKFLAAPKYKNNKNKELKQLAKGFKRTIIFGSSETINDIDITKFANDFVITVGNFHEHPDIDVLNPNIHIFAASHPPITSEVLASWYKRCDERLPVKTPVLVECRDMEVAQECFKNRKIYVYKYGYSNNFPVDFTKEIMSPWSVSIVALQLAIFVQSSEIYLLGINHDWQCIKPYLHFYDHSNPSLEYYLGEAGVEIAYEIQKQPFPKERLYREYELYQQYETLKKEAKIENIDIFNGDSNSTFDVFERKVML